MLDIKFVRENPKIVKEICENRGLKLDIDKLLSIDSQRVKLQMEVEDLRHQSNKNSSLIKTASENDKNTLIKQGSILKKQIKELEEKLSNTNKLFQELYKNLPNQYADDTPLGGTEDDNIELEVFGNNPQYKADSLDHINIGESLGLDFASGTKVAGSGFPLLKGQIAMLEDAILRFTIDSAINSGFTRLNVPVLAKTNILEGLGFNPRREDEGTEIFSTVHDNLCLAGTAEIPLVGQYTDTIIEERLLPVKIVAQTPCFRREGAYGRRDAGLYRNKMFNKVELVIISKQEESEHLLEEIKEFEINIFKQLGIYFRVVRICAGDLGAPAYKKYDLEGWMIGRGADGEPGWGELTSCSNCTDYQSRRLKIRYKDSQGKNKIAHTLNGTGITTRALIPILEQNQQSDGTVNIPDVLQKYLGGLKNFALS